MRKNPSSAKKMMQVLKDLWPLHRTINSDDMEVALGICKNYLKDDRFVIHRFKPGTDIFTWRIPGRYHVKEAWLEVEGRKIADFHENYLHLLSYSLPQEIHTTLGEIRDHIWTSPQRPNAIPWEFKYYERDWGFCLRHSDIEHLSDDAEVHGRIDVEVTDEDFCLAELYLPGDADEDVLFMTNICHPYQANDSLAGLVVGLEMARLLRKVKKRRLGFRLLIVPETIGTLAWFAKNPRAADSIKYAWFCEMVGHDNSFILQHSRQKNSLIDKVFLSVLQSHRLHGQERTGLFRKVVASDEIVSNGPGIDIPTPSLTRWPYPEYHTSDDNPGIVRDGNLAETLDVMLEVWDLLEDNYYPRRKFFGPVMLSRYGLWVDWREDWDLNLQTESIMLMLEGEHSVFEIAFELGLPFATVRTYLDSFFEAGLIEKSWYPWKEKAPSLSEDHQKYRE